MKTLAIRDSAKNGFYNMAVDICSAKLIEAGKASAIFRTYTWQPHCLSIGRFQKPETEADVARLLADGYHIVRRPTGGRAVWHGDELTYCLTATIDHPLVSGGISESLGKVASILVSALHAVGVPGEMNPRERELSRAGRGFNPCFTSHGRYEIMTPDGRKMVGSAQARIRGVFMEHGSILFTNQQTMAVDYMPAGTDPGAAGEMRSILNRSVGTLREYQPAITEDHLSRALHRSFTASVPTPPEEFLSEELPGLKEAIMERRRIIEG